MSKLFIHFFYTRRTSFCIHLLNSHFFSTSHFDLVLTPPPEKPDVEHGHGAVQPAHRGRIRRAFQSDLRIRLRLLEDRHLPLPRRRVSGWKSLRSISHLEENYRFIKPTYRIHFFRCCCPSVGLTGSKEKPLTRISSSRVATGNPVVFTLQPPECYMEIRYGYGTTGTRVAGPVRVGDPLTLIIYMRSKYGIWRHAFSPCTAQPFRGL